MNNQAMSQRGAAQAVAETREANRFLAADQEQVQRTVSLMRRVEELGERLLGSLPATDADPRSGPAPAPAGTFGAFVEHHQQRDVALDRIEGALARIEKVL